MKTLGKVVGVILICLVLVLVVLRITGLNPHERIPGLWLTGELVTTPVTDWSFVDQYQTDALQTRTWYLLPHSVTTNFVVHNGQVYLTSVFVPGTFPQDKRWTSNVARDPHVRLKFGNQLYDRILSHVTDPAELESLTEAAKTKYPVYRELGTASASDGSRLHLFQVLPE